jgi:hypothetical protein
MQTSSQMAVSRAIARAIVVLLLVGGERTGRGELVTPAQKDLRKAERKLEAARGWVGVTAETVSAAGSLRTAREWVVRACQASLAAVERVQNEAKRAEALARIDVVEAEQLAGAARKIVDASRGEMERARDRFLDRSLVAYDLLQRGKLTFNALTGAFDLRVDEGPGITLRADDFEALLGGHFTPRDVDSLELAVLAPGIRTKVTSSYAEVLASLAAEHGAANVYLLSQRFLEWASAARLSGDFVEAIVAEGGTVEGQLAEARRQIALEYEDFAVWLGLKGISDLGPDPCGALAELIRTGSYPRLGLAIKTRPIDFTYGFEPAGSTQIPDDFLRRLQPKRPMDRRAPSEMTERRAALAVVWCGPGARHNSLVSQLESDFRRSALAFEELPRLLPSQTDPRIRRLARWTAPHGLPEIDSSVRPRQLAQAALGLRKEDIMSSAVPGCIIVDLRRSDFGEILTSFLSQLALGNSKSCKLSTLELDQANGRLEAEFTLHHRHVWPIHEAQAKLRAALGPIGTEVDDLADRLTDSSYQAARKLYREADSQAREATAKAHAVAQKAREATDRVAIKVSEYGTLTADLTRAHTDLRAASELEARARRDAQAACVAMLDLDAQVRLARNKTRGLEPPTAANALIYGGHSPTKKW